MAEIKWSDAQLTAINGRAKKILVSAAAGSGKSTVLTERIISSLLSDERNFDISRLLVATFTKESAEDLKLKISSELRIASTENPKNIRLAEQMIKMPSAQIGTIHSICLNIIKNNFSYIDGLSASVRVGNEAELDAIKTDVMNTLLEEAFSGNFAPIPDFQTFASYFISDSDKDTKLSDIFFSIYGKIKNQPNGFSDLSSAIKIMNEGNLSSNDPFSIEICRYIEMFSDYAVTVCTNALNYFASDENYMKSAGAIFEEYRLFFARLHELSLTRDYRKLREFVPTFQNGKLGRLNSDKTTPEGEFYRTVLKKYICKQMEKLTDSYFCFSDEDISYLSKVNTEISSSLLTFLEAFDTRFKESKNKRSIIDYNDIEHYTLALLYDKKTGALTETAIKLSKSFDEIYVDEYQDINPLQNKIFEALSCHAPIFMVGDIKQSIYAFRGAMPTIFSNYRRSFADVSKNDTQTAKIFLSDNYRSERGVTEFANAVSDAMFYSPEGECFDYRIPYSKEDRLICNKSTEAPPDVTIMIAESEKADSEDSEKASKQNISLEAEMVAKKITELINDGVRPSDIAVLLRSAKNLLPKFEQSFRRHGIPMSSDKGSSLFDNPEIQLALCLLNCVDNPYRDIFLAGALKSPVFAFTLDELIIIRQTKKDAPLYEALTDYTYSHDFTKGSRFLSFLERMRAFAISSPVDRVIWQIYTETSLFSLIYDSDTLTPSLISRRRGNLIRLHALASEFTASGKTDLFGFIEQLRNLAESSNPPSSVSDESSGVKILSVHQSKGLEFEHCFLCGTGHDLNSTDLRNSQIYHSKYGLAMKVKDELSLTSSESPYRLALARQLELTQTDEEMRILYVAMTRAKHALYICAELKNFEETKLICQMKAKAPHPMAFLWKRQFIHWILTAVSVKTDLSPRYKTEIFSEKQIVTISENGDVAETTENLSVQNEKDTEEIYKRLSEKLSYRYPHMRSANIPSKLAVSKLYPSILDENEVEIIPDFDGSDLPFVFDDTDFTTDSESNLLTPKFMSDSPSHSGAEQGTATHIFMQFCDFDLLAENGFESELSRLEEKRFITSEMASIVNRNHIEGFLNSEIYLKMKNASNLQREYRFNIKLPASNFTLDPELKDALKNDHIFVQGVIDCYFTENGQNVLLDYKTDRIPKDIYGKPKLEDEFFRARYSRQLGYYKTALEKLTGRSTAGVLIYSFALQRTIEL